MTIEILKTGVILMVYIAFLGSLLKPPVEIVSG